MSHIPDDTDLASELTSALADAQWHQSTDCLHRTRQPGYIYSYTPHGIESIALDRPQAERARTLIDEHANQEINKVVVCLETRSDAEQLLVAVDAPCKITHRTQHRPKSH